MNSMNHITHVKILLIEDNTDHIDLFKDNLEMTSFYHTKPDITASLAHGIKLLTDKKYDLLFLDLELIDSGIGNTLGTIKNLTKICPVVVLTSLDDRETILNVIRKGADDCLPKSDLSPSLLERCIQFNIDRRREREKLLKSEASLAEAQRIAGIGNWDWEISTNELSWSDEVYRIFGLKPQEFRANNDFFFGILHKDDRNYVQATVSKSLQGKKPYNFYYRIVTPEGSEKIIHEQAGVSFDVEGKPLRMTGTIQDVTSRRKTEEELNRYRNNLEAMVEERTVELKKINDQLKTEITNRKEIEKILKTKTCELTQSNEELGRFAYVASHDLQEPLRKVVSYTELFESKYKGFLDKKADKYIDYIIDGAKRMQELISDLLRFSQVGNHKKEFEPVDCNNVLDTVLFNLQLMINENHATVHYETLPEIIADRVQIIQLFQNLIGNAIKYRTKEAPVIKVLASPIENSSKDNGESAAGDKNIPSRWLFSVSDNGIGIDEQHKERIFLMFHRLHGRLEYSGTGIGLAISKKIVERHGGHIWVESESGKGSTFYFFLSP